MKKALLILAVASQFVFSQQITFFGKDSLSPKSIDTSVFQISPLIKKDIYKNSLLFNKYLYNQNLKYKQGYQSPFDYQYPKVNIYNPNGASSMADYAGFGVLNYLFEKIDFK